MNNQYDAIVLGTSVKECVLASLFAMKGMKVLQVDRNPYLGGDTAHLDLKGLWQKFRPGQEPPKEYGSSGSWNIDLVPKCVLAKDIFVKLLLQTEVTKFFEWKGVDNFVCQVMPAHLFRDAHTLLHHVPSHDMEVMGEPWLGLNEIKKLTAFYLYCQQFNDTDPQTWNQIDVYKVPMSFVFRHFGIDKANVIEVLGHAYGLQNNDLYLT